MGWDAIKHLRRASDPTPTGAELDAGRTSVSILEFIPTTPNNPRQGKAAPAAQPAIRRSSAKMAAINKIALNSPSRQNPSELENAIAGALFDLESNTQDLKATLRPLQFVSAREKFSDRHVLFVAQRRILPKPKRSVNSRTNQKQKRPRSRTLTAVHDAILGDLVYPVEIVGKRIRTKEDGSKTLKVILDEKERGGVDHRLDAYGEVYRRLTGRNVVFEFPQSSASDF
ncbi:unnamed protein product [Aspergillus oryzae]|uniref:40S ribosomal protein S7 n=1 Tax=Aspergillus oryzae TaxID=5062 RepID=A0AAN4YMB7_ASPOZ|nr:unnamed protein product [Aspergillus oryzae]GMF85692.1 unnamed protein product [Aspergillus oryzae]GMG04502.1 unnamed protein product [Aspergillus oryzae]GMG32089.1 unnamed protein product [Aspergillus oryzae]